MTIKKSLRTLTSLLQEGLVDKKNISLLEKVADDFSIAITPEMLQLIDKNNPNDPIAQQFVPTSAELEVSANEQADPIGDAVYTTVKGIVHRYPDRCLFMPVQVCPVYCRYCFRREKVGDGKETLTPAELEQAYDYLRSHPGIWEVILTGGDPLILKPAVLKKMFEQLNAIPHLDVIRIHTRVPVVDSGRITAALISSLASSKAVYVVIHANHAREFTEAAKQACAQLIAAGIPLLSQTVLLKGVNDDIDTLSDLMRCFVKHKIKPYYLHQGDLAKGTAHFRTTIAKGQQLMKQLRGRFSGLCQPTYVLDIPGGHGKVPIDASYIHPNDNNNGYCIEDYQGHFHDYPLDDSSLK